MMTGDSHNPFQQVWDGMGQSDAQTPQLSRILGLQGLQSSKHFKCQVTERRYRYPPASAGSLDAHRPSKPRRRLHPLRRFPRQRPRRSGRGQTSTWPPPAHGASPWQQNVARPLSHCSCSWQRRIMQEIHQKISAFRSTNPES